MAWPWNLVENNTIRELGYGFLFAFHSYYNSILYNFLDKARYWSKIESAVFKELCKKTKRLQFFFWDKVYILKKYLIICKVSVFFFHFSCVPCVAIGGCIAAAGLSRNSITQTSPKLPRVPTNHSWIPRDVVWTIRHFASCGVIITKTFDL